MRKGCCPKQLTAMLPFAVIFFTIFGVLKAIHSTATTTTLRLDDEDGSRCNFNQMCSCKMDETQIVTCIKVPFYRLPDFPNKMYVHVDIMSSNIDTIENESFGNSKIESIRIMNNEVTYVAPRAFAHMDDTLRSLDLSFNKIVEFPYKAFRDITHLDWLNLNGNEIASLDREEEFYEERRNIQESLLTLFLASNDIVELSDENNSISRYRRLTSLNMDNNNIRTIANTNFPTSLRTLSLCNNRLTELPTDVMESLPELSRLFLRGNHIKRLTFAASSAWMNSKRRLEKLDLGENYIEKVALIDELSLKSAGAGAQSPAITIRDLHLDSNDLTALPTRCFRGMNVARLYLSRNKLERLDEKSLHDLANSLEYLDLERNRIGTIPSAALSPLKRLKYLYISSNGIGNVSDNAFGGFCSSLKALSLSGNQLTQVPKAALTDCNKLTHINLGYNFVREIAEDDFKSWGENLDTILLINNKITEINAFAFRRSGSRLRELSLSFNKITCIHAEAFVDLSDSLESLEISFGLFQEDLVGDFLKPLSSLLWLALDNNNIHSISSDALTTLKNLQYLNLDGNHLTELPERLLSQAVHGSLREIRLNNNHLTHLQRGLLTGLAELQNVLMCRNEIRLIDSQTFTRLPNLSTVLLARNRIRTIADGAFDNLPRLSRLDLQYNLLESFDLSAFRNVSIDRPLSINASHNRIFAIRNIASAGHSVTIDSFDLSYNRLVDVTPNFLIVFRTRLKSLDLSRNKISKLNANAFYDLHRLNVLVLSDNDITNVHENAFHRLPSLQVLDLAGNGLEYLPMNVFNSTRSLRVLNLSRNDIRSLPKNLFTRLNAMEILDFSHNALNVVPSLMSVKSNLKRLDMSYNRIEHLDSTVLNEAPYLSVLNLAHNRLTILPDNVFTSIGSLLTLHIGQNRLRANFKELFHYLQKLTVLNLTDSNLRQVPPLPLPMLIRLRLSHNQISRISVDSVENLSQLRYLHLDHNQLTHVPGDVWSYLPLLKELDISNNPIKVLSKESFLKLPRLQTLNLQHLNQLQKIDTDVFQRNHILTNLKIDAYHRVEYISGFQLGNLLSSVRSLRSVSVRILSDKLTDQLNGLFHRKLRELEITGENLKFVRQDAFKGIEATNDLLLRITGTSIEDLPAGLFEGIQEIAHLSLDFSNNKLFSLTPAVLYHNVTNWENVGTKLVEGGLILKGNPWSCDCGLVWLGHWMRRWLRESLEIHTLVLEEAQQMEDIAREATCFDQRTKQQIPIVDLHPRDLSCQASALSGDGSHLLRTRIVACVLRTLTVFAINRIAWNF